MHYLFIKIGQKFCRQINTLRTATKLAAIRMPTIMKFMVKSKPFHEFLFNSTTINETEPTDSWKSQTIGNNDEIVLGMTQWLFSAQASASVGRIIVII